MLGFTKLALIAVVALMPPGAIAASDDTRSISVRTDDINMNTARGQKILALRIDRAARGVCDFANDRFGPKIRKIERTCRDRAKASAWATVKTGHRLGIR